MSVELQHAIEQFYYREARLLDGRQYQQWLALVTEDIQYEMPSRTNPMVDNRLRGTEEMLSVERELEDAASDGLPLREENYVHLMMRVERAYKINSWAENPPARTRRIIANVEVLSDEDDELAVLSNFILYYSRNNNDNFMYTGQRRDTLRRLDGEYKIAYRMVITDFHVIEAPTMGLFF